MSVSPASLSADLAAQWEQWLPVHVWALPLIGPDGALRGVLLLARDAILAVVMALLKRRGIIGLPVHFLGKAATFNLLYAFPLLLLGDGATGTSLTVADVARDVGWAFAIWGTALYWWAGLLYLEQARRILRSPAS